MCTTSEYERVASAACPYLLVLVLVVHNAQVVVIPFDSTLYLKNEFRTHECSQTHVCQTFVSRPV